MTIDLSLMIPVDWISKVDRERVDLAQRRRLNREGYWARKTGVKMPRFVDPDMAIYWQAGWREADQEIAKHESQKP